MNYRYDNKTYDINSYYSKTYDTNNTYKYDTYKIHDSSSGLYKKYNMDEINKKLNKKLNDIEVDVNNKLKDSSFKKSDVYLIIIKECKRLEESGKEKYNSSFAYRKYHIICLDQGIDPDPWTINASNEKIEYSQIERSLWNEQELLGYISLQLYEIL